jgi:hypothetical protein
MTFLDLQVKYRLVQHVFRVSSEIKAEALGSPPPPIQKYSKSDPNKKYYFVMLFRREFLEIQEKLFPLFSVCYLYWMMFS